MSKSSFSKIFNLCIFVIISLGCLTVLAAPWAVINGYYPGMSKEAAKKIGLKDCAEKYGHVVCSPTAPVSIGGITPRSFSIEFEDKSAKISSMHANFPTEEISETKIRSAMESQFGPGKEFSTEDNCLRDIEWTRQDDEKVSLCIAVGSGKWRSHYVNFQYQIGLSQRLAKDKSYAEKKKQAVNSFNSK